MDAKYYCPQCGTELQQGEYRYDYDSGNLLVEHCPNCDCMDRAVKMEEDE